MSFQVKQMIVRMCLLCAAVVFACGPAFSENAKPEGEMIVKFAAEHPINAEILTLLTHNESSSERVKQLVREIGDELGVALRFERITSGREVVINIPREKALEQLATQLAATSGVDRVKILCAQEKTAPFESYDELVVSFDPDTSSYQAAEAVAQRDNSPERSVQALINELTETTPYELDGRVLPDKRLALRLDLAQTASRLASQLNDLGDVEYAQPNFAVKAYP